jgi:predicted phosphodiesterase
VRFLCLSDIHGQSDALAAVLATAERRGYDHLLVAGDLCFPGPEPLETWRRLMRAQAVCVRGIGDRALATLDPSQLCARTEHERERLERLERTRTELGELVLAQLQRLPDLRRIPLEGGGELVLVHGAPADPTESLTFDMSDEELLPLLGDAPGSVVVCGGSHVPFDRTLGRVRVINVGSVGEARSADDSHRRWADATFLEILGDEVRVEQLAVPLGRAA